MTAVIYFRALLMPTLTHDFSERDESNSQYTPCTNQTVSIHPVRIKQSVYTLYESNSRCTPCTNQSVDIHPVRIKQSIYTLYESNSQQTPCTNQTVDRHPVRIKQSIDTLSVCRYSLCSSSHLFHPPIYPPTHQPTIAPNNKSTTQSSN